MVQKKQRKTNGVFKQKSTGYTDISCLCDYGLEQRYYFTLKRCGINTVEELTAMSDKELLLINTIGILTLEKVRSAMDLKQSSQMIL